MIDFIIAVYFMFFNRAVPVNHANEKIQSQSAYVSKFGVDFFLFVFFFSLISGCPGNIWCK